MSGSRINRGVLCFSVAVCLSSGILFVNAAEPYYGKFIGSLRTQHHAVTGDVYAVDSRNLHIRNFNYDGEGPAAYFYAGNSKAPSSSGFQLRDEKGKSVPLKKYRNEHLTVTLPDGKTLNNIKWFSVWCDEFAVNFGDVKIPKNFEYPKPLKIGQLSGIHGVSSDNVIIVDAQTLLIQSFSYDGEAPDAKFWVGRGPTPSPQGIRVPDENGKELPLKRYNRKHIVLTLPRDLTVFDIGHFGVWCEAFTVDFGHVEIPQTNLNVPPSLKMLGVSPQKSPQSLNQLLGLVDQARQPQQEQQQQQVYYQQQSTQLQPAYQHPQLIQLQQPLQYASVPATIGPQQSQPIVQPQFVLQQAPQPFTQQQQQPVAFYDPTGKQQYILDPVHQNLGGFQLIQQTQPQNKPTDQPQAQSFQGQGKRTQSQTNKRQQPAEFYNENFLKYDNVLPLLNIRQDTLRPTTYKPNLRQYLEESVSSNGTLPGAKLQTTTNDKQNQQSSEPENKSSKDATLVQIIPSIAINPPNLIYPPDLVYNNIYDPNLLYYGNNIGFVDEKGKAIIPSPNGPLLASPQPQSTKAKLPEKNQTQAQPNQLQIQSNQPPTQLNSQPYNTLQFSPDSLLSIPQTIDNIQDFQPNIQIAQSQVNPPPLGAFRPGIQPFSFVEQPNLQLANLAQFNGPSVPPPNIQPLGNFNGLPTTTNLKSINNQLLQQPQSQSNNFQNQNEGRPPIYPSVQPDNVRIVTYNQAPQTQQLQQNQNPFYSLPPNVIQENQPTGLPNFDLSLAKGFSQTQSYSQPPSFAQSQGFSSHQSFSSPQFSLDRSGRAPGFLRF